MKSETKNKLKAFLTIALSWLGAAIFEKYSREEEKPAEEEKK